MKALDGIYGDCRQVKKLITLGDAIIEVQIPAEDYKRAVQLLDGRGVIVTVAPANLAPGYGPVKGNVDPPQRSFEELPPSQQAAIRCKDEGFRHWIGATSEDDCVLMVRERCGIDSRRELDTPGMAQDLWVALNNAFWAETRGYQEEG